MVASSRFHFSASAVARAMDQVLDAIPSSDESHASDPRSRSRRLRSAAARKAAAISTGLSLPPGPIGMLTVLPDLMAIWRLQSALVADIAAAHGRKAELTRETMLACLFKHGGAALLRDVVVRVGQRAAARSFSRWVPIVGAVGIGAYAYYDTKKVGDAAIEVFSAEPAAPADPDET